MMDRRLGRGLESLIARTGVTPDRLIHELPVDDIVPNPHQPRQGMNEAALEALAQSIRAHGVLQPIVVRRAAAGGFELIAGERRLRASRLAGKPTIPATIMESAEMQSLELALIENIQRENLNPLEEAEAFQEILASTAMTQQHLSERLGRSRASVTNALRLLDLPERAKQLMRDGALSAGQAKVLLSAESRSDIDLLAAEAVRQNWSVRELERRLRAKPASRRRRMKRSSTDVHRNAAAYEEQLRIIFGTKVRIDGGPERGRIALDYYSAEDLSRLVNLMLAAGLVLDDGKRRSERGTVAQPPVPPAGED